MNRWFAHVWLAASLVGGTVMAQGTRLATGDTVLFESAVPVTFGASYGERAVQATLVATAEARVSIRVGS